ncbi:MAG TPA: efflux RND transporter periplasmic adaptor subunit [Polyangiales bacterium]|nr:efflux RND transporter periplasmic adaptor subunit [Polyangiales bacterium]
MGRAGRFSIGLLYACAALGCERAAEPARAKILTPVRVRTVEERNQLSQARYSGTLEPRTRVDLAFKVGGYVRELAQLKSGGETRKIQEGDFVSKGTVLAVVRESDYEQKVAAAQAGLAEAQAFKKQAQLDFDRAQKLTASNAMATLELDAQSSKLETANARVESAKARIQEAQLALGDCTMRAPIDGVLLKRPIEVGSLVGPGTVGFVIADTTSVKVLFGAPDRLVEKLKPGGSLTVTFDAVPGEFNASISRISPSADPKSRVFEIEATIPNPKNQLHVGMIAKLSVSDAEAQTRSLVLPLTAVVRSPRDARGFSVFVVEQDRGKDIARMRDVKLGDVVGNVVVVADGIKPSERVVSMGATLLAEGESVRVIPN